MKLKTIYSCQNCSYQSSKWMGRCPSCEEWNTFSEDVINIGKAEVQTTLTRSRPLGKPQSIELKSAPTARASTGIGEFDQVLGGGFVEGSLTLLSGEPGIGKSTLTLQIVERMAAQKESVLYVTGEESIEQVSDRAKRLDCTQNNIELLFETSVENILATLESRKPAFLVVDSIQVMASADIVGAAGSLSQVRYTAELLMNTIKTLKIPTLLIGHVNKEGNIAGPKVLEHLVDTVLILEGERDHELRMLRAVKNRFGSVSEVGLFEMSTEGLRELKNPGQRLLENRPVNAIGSCLTLSMEGNRPLLMEVQALVSQTPFGYPKRMASGFDRNRLELLLAVMQKHTNLNLMDQDVYIKVTGGLYLSDPAADLAVCMATASSLLKKAIPESTVVYGELGLTGEIRNSYKDAERKKTAEKLGLKTISRKNKLVDALLELKT